MYLLCLALHVVAWNKTRNSSEENNTTKKKKKGKIESQSKSKAKHNTSTHVAKHPWQKKKEFRIETKTKQFRFNV
jgi:hypothetical protein